MCPYGLLFDFGAHTAFAFDCDFDFDFDFDFDLPPPVHRLNFSSASGGVRRGLSEHVAAQQIVQCHEYFAQIY